MTMIPLVGWAFIGAIAIDACKKETREWRRSRERGECYASNGNSPWLCRKVVP